MILVRNGAKYAYESDLLPSVMMRDDLTDGAKVLYSYYFGLCNGAIIDEVNIIDTIEVSRHMLTKHKKELKDAGLLMFASIVPRVTALYLGHNGLTAKAVKLKWDLLHNPNKEK